MLLLAFGRPGLALLAGALLWSGSSAEPPVLRFADPPPAKAEFGVQENLRAQKGALELPALEDHNPASPNPASPNPASPNSDPSP